MSDSPDHRHRLREVALLFIRLGFTAFGGPPAHVAMMEDEVVVRRGWVDRQHFLDLLASVNFVPGPNSTELAIHLGFIRAGYAGLVVAGACFIVPAMLIILPLGYLYVRSGSLPETRAVMSGISACVVAIIAAAAIRFARAAVTDWFTAVVAVAAIIASYFGDYFRDLNPELIILGTAAVLGAIYYGRPRLRVPEILPALLPLAASPTLSHDLARLFLFFLKVGGTLFGSGYVLVSYLRGGLVDHFHWLTEKQLLDAVAVASLAVILIWNINPTWLILASGVIGVLRLL